MGAVRPSHEDLVADIYEAALDMRAWSRVVARLAQRHDACATALHSPVEGAHERYPVAVHGVEPDLMRAYGEYWHAYDPWSAASVLNRQRAGTVTLGESVVPERELRRTPYYNEYLTPAGIGHSAAAVIFDGGDNALAPRTYLALFGSPRRGAFDSDTLAELKALYPHVRRALTIHWAQRRAQEALALRDAALDAQLSALFWLSPQGHVLLANAAARALLSTGDLLRANGDRLASFAVRAGMPLLDALASACAGRAVTVALIGKRRYVAHFLPPRAIEAGGRAIFGVLLQIDSADCANEAGAFDAVRRLYGLTHAEADVLTRIAAGDTPREIADHQRVSISTVRTHLKSLFAKTTTRRQADLVRLAIEHAAKLRPQPDK